MLFRSSSQPLKLHSSPKHRPHHQQSQEKQRRDFHVHPDEPFVLSSLQYQLPRAVTRNTLQSGFRRFAGRMMQKVNNIGSGNARQGHPVADSVNSNRKGSLTQDTNLPGTKRKRGPMPATKSNHTIPTLSEENLASIQPLRRTRSIARRLEQIGLPISRAIDNEEAGSSARQTESEDEADSVERSIAEMSLDEISEHKDGPVSESLAEESGEHFIDPGKSRANLSDTVDDAWYLQYASPAQLQRLRKDKLLLLVSIIEKEGEDRSIFTKDLLIKLLLDARVEPNHLAPDSESASSSENEAADESAVKVLANRRRYSTRHARRSSAASSLASTSAPASSQHSPQRRRRGANRSQSFPQMVDSSAGENGTAEGDLDQLQAKRYIANHRRTTLSSSSLGMGRPDAIERTPGRLRSGKLRASGSGILFSDTNDHNLQLATTSLPEEEVEEDDILPTPIARRTRHQRTVSAVSASSAAHGDDEDGDLPNHEYRLRKISLSRRAKRGSCNLTLESEDTVAPLGDGTIVDGDHQEKEDSPANEEEEPEDLEAEELNHDEQFNFASATLGGLMRLRRDDLIKLCRDRDIGDKGTKNDLANALLGWYSGQQDKNENLDPSSPSSSSNEDEDDGEFCPAGDMSIISSSSDVEEADELASPSPAKSDRSDSTARQALTRARNETKTQALAKLSNQSQSYDSASQEKPILLQGQDHLIHSAKVDTPPGSGDQQDNDLELDLESLNLLDKEIAPDKLKKGEKIGSGGFKDV